MSCSKTVLAGVAVLLAMACKSKGDEAAVHDDEHGKHVAHDEHEEPGEDGEHHEEAEEDHDADGRLVRIASEMLRDLRVTTAKAESRPSGDAVTALGELRVNEEAYAEVGSPIPARVSRVMAAAGDVVTAGQLLVELESADVGRARATIQTAKARLDLARQTVERRRPLAADQIVPQRELQAAESEAAQAEAEYKGAQQALAGLGSATGRGARFTLATPIAGTVIDRTALRGQRVDAEHSLFVVADLARLWLVVHGFERDALRMRTGTAARVSFPALPGQSFPGTVTWIGSRVDPSSRTIDVRIEVDNPSGTLRPGMSGSALVPLGSSDEKVVAVPAVALQWVQDGWCVFLPRDAATFEVRPVGRGRDLGGAVEVLSGLKAGETVVVEGAFLLKAEHDKARGGGEGHQH